ncbi:hypothetical protein HHI36_009852 [Cryptolaemus montrouzieri]|uniref:TIL domain-containing protein n=1 Tax=Cryptolaemus montrouzieri TaxID=559131 RepID=A0ABD2MHF2_9CUCU
MFSIVQLTILVLSVVCISSERVKSPRCPLNEHWTTCVNACARPTCADPRPPDCQFLVCNEGCECDEGYVRTKKPDGNCIPIEKCKNCLKPEYEFQEFGLRCNTSCGPYAPDLCTFGSPGCYCKKPKVYDWNVKKCVLRENCSI